MSKRLAGATLAEVLVMMIVAGIVFLSVMDGLGLLRRHTTALAGRIAANSRFYEGYYRLEDMATGADSITRYGAGVACWRGGALVATIVLHDSALVAYYGPVADTLMHRVGSFGAPGAPDAAAVDSLVAEVRAGDGALTISFPVTRPLQAVAAQSIEEREKEYEYE